MKTATTAGGPVMTRLDRIRAIRAELEALREAPDLTPAERAELDRGLTKLDRIMRERRVPYQKLTRLVLLCRNCEAEITLDLMNKHQVSQFETKLGLNATDPLACPVCGHHFDKDFGDAIQHFKRRLKQVKDSGQKMDVIISLPAAKEED